MLFEDQCPASFFTWEFTFAANDDDRGSGSLFLYMGKANSSSVMVMSFYFSVILQYQDRIQSFGILVWAFLRHLEPEWNSGLMMM